MLEMRISSANPGLLVFVLDDSGSEKDCFPGTTDPVFAWIERYCGIIVRELLARSTEVVNGTSEIKPRYYIVVIKYGTDPQLWFEDILDIQSAADKYTQAGNSFGLGGLLGGTDAKQAFEMAYDILKKAVADPKFKNSFPPMVLHLTDGLSSTDASKVVKDIRGLSTNDGNVIVVNGFIGTDTSLKYNGPEDFPGYTTAQQAGPSPDNVRLFEMSSQTPETIYNNLISDGIFPQLNEDTRLFFDVRTKEMLKHVIQVVSSVGPDNNRTQR